MHRKRNQKAWEHDTINGGYRNRSTSPTPSIHRQGREQRQRVYAARVESEAEAETEFAVESASERENESASNIDPEFNLVSMDPSGSRSPTCSQSESELASISPPEPESESDSDSSANYNEEEGEEEEEYDRDDDDDENDDPDDPAYPDMSLPVQTLRNESVQRLAAAWNDIFERYGKEPSELPPDDEIDLGTGELIVDNGVLRSQGVTLFGALTSLGKELKEPLKLERRRHRARIHRVMRARIPGASNRKNNRNASDTNFPSFNSKSGTQAHLLIKEKQNGYNASSLDDKPERYRGDDFDNLFRMPKEPQVLKQQSSLRRQQERTKWPAFNAHGFDDYESEDDLEEEISVEEDQRNSDEDAEYVSERKDIVEEEQGGGDEEPVYNSYSSESGEEGNDDDGDDGQDSWEDEQENTVHDIVDDPDVIDFEDRPDLETDTQGDNHLVDSSIDNDDDNEDKGNLTDWSQYSHDSVDGSNPFIARTSQSGTTTRPVLRDTQPVVGAENMAHSKAIWRSLDIHQSPTSWTKVSTYKLFPRDQRTERKGSTHIATQDEVDGEYDDVAKDMRRISPPVTSLSPMAARFHTALSFNAISPRQRSSRQQIPCQQRFRHQPLATPRTMTARARALADSLLSGKDTPQTPSTPYATSTPSLTSSVSPPYSPVSKKRRRTSPEPEMRPVQRLNTGQGFLDFDLADLFRDDPFFDTSTNSFTYHDTFEGAIQSSPN
ncbi:hypothetical protein BGZ51_008116 [Haplosporangium sp. Z 767]|nr:hypothetical protein BGZ51_008116 [Haplosporangium sp. Z 767]KAF9180239.1 hypothetical protein BGZ50_006370 [Haplosporangium sp. Z 11]